MKPPAARKLADGPTTSYLATGGFKYKLFQNAGMIYKHAVVAAFRIYAKLGEDAAKRGVWRR